MALPKRKTSKSRCNMRKANYLKLDSQNHSKCPQCNEPKLPHRVCIHCGFYKGREIIPQDERRQK